MLTYALLIYRLSRHPAGQRRKRNRTALPPDNDENGIAQPSERFIEQIKEDFLGVYDFDNGAEAHISEYYGVYNGNCVPLVINVYPSASIQMLIECEIAGETFIFGDGSETIDVWVNGEFFTLEEAYEKGYLTAEQIADIAEIRRSGEYLSFEEPGKVTESSDDTDAPDTTFIYEEPVPCVTES